MDSNNIIKKLKSHFGVFTDTALADKLNVSQPTIASWKSRKIPNHILMQYSTILGDLVQADSDMVANREPKTVSGVGESVVVEEKPIHINKGEQQVDASYIIDLQKDKIESQKREIARLSTIVNQQKETKKKPAFHFKTKVVFDPKTKMFGKNKVTGDTSMTGYTREFLSNLKNEEWSAMYHPESLQQLMSSIPDEVPDHTHNKWKNILWKAKNGTYRVYNIESYHDKKEGIVRAYYYWVNGDIEGQS